LVSTSAIVNDQDKISSMKWKTIITVDSGNLYITACIKLGIVYLGDSI
jgi:hypothetical protein